MALKEKTAPQMYRKQKEVTEAEFTVISHSCRQELNDCFQFVINKWNVCMNVALKCDKVLYVFNGVSLIHSE